MKCIDVSGELHSRAQTEAQSSASRPKTALHHKVETNMDETTSSSYGLAYLSFLKVVLCVCVCRSTIMMMSVQCVGMEGSSFVVMVVLELFT